MYNGGFIERLAQQDELARKAQAYDRMMEQQRTMALYNQGLADKQAQIGQETLNQLVMADQAKRQGMAGQQVQMVQPGNEEISEEMVMELLKQQEQGAQQPVQNTQQTVPQTTGVQEMGLAQQVGM